MALSVLYSFSCAPIARFLRICGSLNARGRYDQAEGGTTEIKAACGFENFAPGPGTTSFANTLIEKLKRHAEWGDVFSATSLHQQVVEPEEEGPLL